jgi:hypothetical protein
MCKHLYIYNLHPWGLSNIYMELDSISKQISKVLEFEKMCQNWWVQYLKLEGSTTNLHLDNLHTKKKKMSKPISKAFF